MRIKRFVSDGFSYKFPAILLPSSPIIKARTEFHDQRREAPLRVLSAGIQRPMMHNGTGDIIFDYFPDV